MSYMKSGSPFLYDDETGDIVGLKDNDGSEKSLVTMASDGLQIGGAAPNEQQRENVLVGLGVDASLRNVATGIRLCWSFNGTNKQTMSRSAHIARSPISTLKLVYGNWRVDFANGDVGSGATTTYKAAIEYPAGVFTQVTFAGETSGDAAELTEIVSDAVDVTIPKGAMFWVRTHTANTAGILYVGKAAAVSLGEAMVFGVTTEDKTLGGTITDGGAGIVAPYAIVSTSGNPAVFIHGDSRGSGNGATGDLYTGNIAPDIGTIARSIGPTHAYINASVPSDTAKNSVLNMPRRVAIAKAYCTHVVVGLGINDVNSYSRTAAQALTDLTGVWGLYSPLPVWQTTIGPITTTTDAWATTANQTVWDATKGGHRVTLNNSIRESVAVSGVFDIADVEETSRDSGVWRAPGFTADGIHETKKACAIIASSGVVNAGVIR